MKSILAVLTCLSVVGNVSVALAQHTSWVEWTESATTGQFCLGGSFPEDEVTQSKTWHPRWRNTCWNGSQPTWASADPTQSASGECGDGGSNACYPLFQAHHSNIGPIRWTADAVNRDWLVGVCRETTIDSISLEHDEHYDTDYPCPEQPSCGEEGASCGDNGDCCSSYCDPNSECGMPTPILISLDSNSSNYHLTGPHDGVLFDMNGDGIRERLSWTPAGKNLAFLVLDRNGD